MKNNLLLQENYIDFMTKHCVRPQYAVTFTFKSKAFIEYKDGAVKVDSIFTEMEKKCPEYKWRAEDVRGYTATLTEDIANSTVDYFYAKLTHKAYGKDSKKTSTKDFSRPMMITTIEGSADSFKRTHLHGVIGNLPDTVNGMDIINEAWAKTDFGGKIVIKKIYDLDGWFDYITKEIKTGKDTAIQIDRIKKPNTYR